MARRFVVSSNDSSSSSSSLSESSGKQRNLDAANDQTNLANLRWTIYLAITSSVEIDEAHRKLQNIKLEPGQEMELCTTLLECCVREKSYIRYYGYLGQRLCNTDEIHQENFEKCFDRHYSATAIHRPETAQLRNSAKFFAHLIATDALPWHVLSYIRLAEESGVVACSLGKMMFSTDERVACSSRKMMFVKILFRELSEQLGIRRLNERLSEPMMQDLFIESIFPRDNLDNARFSVEFFTSIGLGDIVENLRVHLKNMPQQLIKQQQQQHNDSTSESDQSSSTTSSSESDSFGLESDSRKRKRTSNFQFTMKKKNAVKN